MPSKRPDGEKLRAKLEAASVLRSITVSPNGEEIATSGDDGVIRLVDSNTFRLTRQFPDRPDGISVKSIAYSGDGSILMAGSINGKVSLWNALTGERISEFQTANKKLFAVSLYPEQALRWGVISGSDSVEIWNIQKRTLAGKPTHHTGLVRSIAYSAHKSGLFVSGGDDGLLVFYLSGNRQREIRAHRSGVFGVAISHDGGIAVSGGADGLVKLWNPETQSELGILKGHDKYVLTVAISNTSKKVASGGGDKSLRIWSVEEKKQLAALEGHEKDIESISFLSNERLVASVSVDKTLRVWDLDRKKLALTATFYPDGGYLAFSPSGHFVATGNAEQYLEIEAGSQSRALSESDKERFRRSGGLGAEIMER